MGRGGSPAVAEQARKDVRAGELLCHSRLSNRRMTGPANDRADHRVVRKRDLPGALAEVTGCLAELNANIEQISHQRAFTNPPVQTVEVEFVLQTRSHDHVRQAMSRSGEEWNAC